MEDLVKFVQDEFVTKNDLPTFSAGDTITVYLPAIQKIEINKKGVVRRARIFYFRELTGKKARIKEKRG